jgi:hypothetical protein
MSPFPLQSLLLHLEPRPPEPLPLAARPLEPLPMEHDPPGLRPLAPLPKFPNTSFPTSLCLKHSRMNHFISLKNLSQLEILRLKTLYLTTVQLNTRPLHLSHTVQRTLIALDPRLKSLKSLKSLILTTLNPHRILERPAETIMTLRNPRRRDLVTTRRSARLRWTK